MPRALGFFITSLDDDTLPTSQELVAPTDPKFLAAVADYLDRGLVHEQYRGLSWCRFSCGETNMGSRDLTNGEWLWPEGLSHYLRHHSVQLPDEFIAHGLENHPPTSAPKDEPVDLTYWIE